MNHYYLLGFFIFLIIIYTFIFVRIILRKNKIKKKSFFYNKILYLNNNYNMIFFVKQLKFHKKYKSKSAVQKANLSDAAIQYVNENLSEIENLIVQYKIAEMQYINYKKIVDKILSTKVDYSKLKMSKILFFSLKDYVELEKSMINNIVFENKNKFTLYVYVDYLSPKGRSYWYKDYDYSFNNILKFVKTVKQHNEYMKSAKYQRSILSDSLRYDVLKRDNFACKICGASAEKDGAKLEVDHIFPVSKGGKSELSNLQTLCERCNRGKSNKY